MKISVSFRQRESGKSLMKDIELAQLPSDGMAFEYQVDWGLAYIGGEGKYHLYSYVTAEGGGIDGYGPQFTDDEAQKLVALGWRLC